jgi:hypothetical protein
VEYTKRYQSYIKTVWLLDTVPGQADTSVANVLQSIRIVAPQIGSYLSDPQYHTIKNHQKKKYILQLLKEEPYHFNEVMAQWIVSSYDFSQQHFNFDLMIANQYVEAIQQQDMIQMIDTILQHDKNIMNKHNNGDTTNQGIIHHSDDHDDTTTHIHLIQGRKNKAWEQTHIVDTLQDIMQKYPTFFSIHTLPNAGHWVHVDDLRGILDIIRSSL